MPGKLDPKDLPASESDIDFSDLEAKYSLGLDESFDNIILVDGLPKVDEPKFDKLLTVVQKIFKKYGTIKSDGISMPKHKNDDGKTMTAGYLFMEFESAEQAALAVKNVNGYAFDKKHTISVNKFADVEKYSNLKDEFISPPTEEYVEKEHLLSYLSDPLARDQYVTLINNVTSIQWNNRGEAPELIATRKRWTESYVQWSPRGTYLTTLHAQGVAIWGGASWKKLVRFFHPEVKLIDFSPNERYLVTWSNDPIVVEPNSPFGEEDEGHNICIWDVKTGVLLRTFPNLPSQDSEAPLKMSWPAFKWSPNENYFARCVPGQMLSIYQAPSMGLLDKKSIKVDGINDFEWAPAYSSGDKKADKLKKPEDLIVYWTPESQDNPARVTLISVPTKEILRTKNLFNVSDCKFYWHPLGNLLSVRVNRVTKSKKATYTNLEIFRTREKDIPVEVVELKDTVLLFAWEPMGSERFAIISTGDTPPPTAAASSGVAPPTVRTNISVYNRDLVKGTKKAMAHDNFKQVAYLEKRTVNTLVWSPKGRHFVMATLRSQSTFDVEFCDMDFDHESTSKKEASAGLHILATAEHYGLTDIEWDPTGRFVITSSSVWRHNNENGYSVWDFKGVCQYKKVIDNFKQLLWRPRPKPLLSDEMMKKVRKTLAKYSVQFDEEDIISKNAVSAAVLTHRKRLTDEWKAWRVRVEKALAEESLLHTNASKSMSTEEANEEIEEWVEEVVEEFEEVEEE